MTNETHLFLWCVRDEWRQGQTALLTQLLLSTIARCVIFKTHKALLPHLGWSCSTRGRWGQQSSGYVFRLQASSYSGLPVSNWFKGRWHLPIFFHNVHLLPLLLLLIYTGASLIDSSVKGQYTTVLDREIWNHIKVCQLFLKFITWNHFTARN